MQIASYPKVYNIGHAAISDIFADTVLVEEKVDGSQLSFVRVGSELFFRSKGADILADAPEKMFAAGVNAIQEISPSLREGWVYRGEYLAKPKHNVLAYQRVPRRQIILFDINTGDEAYMDRDAKDAEAERVGLEIVPVVYSGRVESPEHLLSFLDHESVLGGQKVEGVVAKNYARFGRDGKALMGKFVREDFKETHAKEWKAANPGIGDVIERLISTLRSEKRWEKAVFHLRDQGVLENSPRDIGNLIKAAQKDISEEEAEFVKQKLYEYAMPRILRASVAGLPEWYKKRLLDSAFQPAAETPSTQSENEATI